jgi:hypothetical protein
MPIEVVSFAPWLMATHLRCLLRLLGFRFLPDHRGLGLRRHGLDARRFASVDGHQA